MPRALISAAVMVALFTNAQAAQLSNIEGLVSVNSGSGFHPASIGSSLAPGDRVRTAEGSANILYDNGCSTKVGPQQVAIVYSEPPACYVGGLKDGVAVAPEEPGVSPLLIGGLAVGAAVGLAFALSGNNHHNVVVPVSP